jgi:hypothetical protein
MRIIEIAAKRQMEARMLEDSQVSYTISFNIGDLVLLSRPKIGSRSKGTATRLLYQNIGPFEVVDKLSDVTYRLRKLGTDKVTSHHVKYINPYLTKQAYEAEVSRATSDEPANFNHTHDSKHPPQFLPRQGDFLFFIGLATKQRPFYLVQVTDYEPSAEFVHFQYLNNSTSKQKYRYCWTKETPTKVMERQEVNQPVGYAPMVQYASIDQFCTVPVNPKVNTDGSLRLGVSEVKRVMQHRPVLGK